MILEDAIYLRLIWNYVIQIVLPPKYSQSKLNGSIDNLTSEKKKIRFDNVFGITSFFIYIEIESSKRAHEKNNEWLMIILQYIRKSCSIAGFYGKTLL